MLRRTFLTLLALTLMAASPAYAADVTVKLATLAPEGSPWWKALRQMGDEWSKLSDGKVEVKIYAGGVVGNESSMVKKMNIGQLHGGQITNLGLKDYSKGPQAMQTPLLIQSYEELDHVLEKLGPVFEEELLANGIVVLNWGDAGWVHLFSQGTVQDLAQTKTHTIYAYEGEPAAVKMFEDFGFKTKVLGATDVLPALQSGQINAFPSTRLGALALQWFALSKNMMDMSWAPLVGATVITKSQWDAIPAEYHEAFRESGRRIGAEMTKTIRKQDEKAVEVMKKYGLTVNPLTDTQRAEWEKKGKETWSRIRGNIVPAEVFDKVKAAVEEARK